MREKPNSKAVVKESIRSQDAALDMVVSRAQLTMRTVYNEDAGSP